MSVFRNIQHEVAQERGFERGGSGRASGRFAAFLMAVALVCSVVPFLGASGTASAAPFAPARASQLDIGGFPLWYQDANGIRVQPCLDPNDPNCVAPISATYDPALPLSFPSNYPDEWFYSAADAQPIVLNECVNPNPVANPGATVHMALEGSYMNGSPIPGDQMVFGRLRVVVREGAGLCPNTWYTFRTPYGPMTLKTDVNAEIQGAAAAAATYDVGCLPGPATPCDFDAALSAPVLGVGLLRSLNIAAPGYLGSGTPGVGGPALSFDAVTGGLNGFNQFDVVRWPAGVTPASDGVGVDCTDAGCTVLGSTDQFSVGAKLAGPFQAGPVDFGGQLIDTTSAARPVSLTNLGSGALGLDATTIDSVAITGGNASQFALSSTDCSVGAVTAPAAATPMARDAACSVNVTFTPAIDAAVSATLEVFYNGLDVPFTVALNGTGILAGQAPAVSYTPAGGNVDFGGVRLSLVGPQQDITITNSGTAPLLAVPSIVASADSAAFPMGVNTCAGAYIAVGASCTIGVRFIPSHVGPVSVLLHVNTNTSLGTLTFDLMGHGLGGIAAVSPTNDPVNTFPDWYQDENGIRTGQCDDPSNTLCVASPLPVVGAAQSFPDNYPDEWFYYLAQSVPMDITDDTCGLTAGGFFIEAGMEAAFLGPIGPNQGITFGRLRVVSRGGLCPNTEYLVTHPYGRIVLVTDDRGQIKPAAGTADVGCVGSPCDYALALAAPVFEGFLTQTVHPDGYLGDPINPSAVSGSPFLDPATGLPANYVTVERLDAAGVPGAAIATTDQFTVSGRLVGPMVATPGAQGFGSAEVGLVSSNVTHTITYTNDGPFPVTLAAAPLAVAGVNAGDFTLASTTCTANMVLAHAATCTATVTFAPAATGNRSAALRLVHSGGNSPLAVALTGVGAAPTGLAAISPSITSVKFTDLKVNVVSESQTITLSNVGGSAPLQVGTPTITAGQPFVVSANTCKGVNVQPDATCTISVQFQPTTANGVGAKTATLTIPSNAKLSQAGAAITLSVPLTGKATNVVASQSASTTLAGFPSWFQDGNGMRLEPCLSPVGTCVLLADPTYDPALPVVWPTNYPTEAFYSLVDSDVVNYGPQACADGSTSAGGFALLRVGTEATFTTPAPAAGAQTFFNRIRITVGGLCPNTPYTFTHPYGTVTLTTDAAGEIRPKTGTFDNTNITGSAPVTTGYVQWDPNSGAAAPVGFIGDYSVLHKVVGSQYRPTVGSEPANYFKVATAAGVELGRTDLFAVSGRIAGPVISSLASKDFGVVEVAKNSTTTSFVISNIGTTPVSAITTALSGTNATLFTITSNTCTTAGVTLATDQTCTIQMQFRPTVLAGVGAKTATLTVSHNGLRSPITIPLSGTANAAQTPALTVTPVSLAFGNVALNTNSAVSTVTIRNSGTGPLRLGTLAVTGTGANQYAITATTCPNGPTANTLAAATSCTVSVRFTPTSTGAKAGTIAVSATDAVTAQGHVAAVMPTKNVALTGTGASAVATLSATAVGIRGTAGSVSTSRITITNSGTAPLTLTGFTSNKAGWTVSFTGCTGAAPGSRTCTATVSWALAANTTIPVNGTDIASITLIGNQSNAVTITATGTRTK